VRSFPENALVPRLAELTAVLDLAAGIKLFRCRPLQDGVQLHYAPGQFGFLSAIGVGEAPFGMAVSEDRGGGQFEFAVQRVGSVTKALHEMQVGDVVGVRGPMGCGFPMDEIRGRRVVILGGGIGMAPLRPLVQEIVDHRERYSDVTVFCAARSPDLLVFRDEYAEWAAAPRTAVHVTIDKGDASWTGRVGLITEALADVAPSPEGAVAITCGPPVMIRFVLKELERLGFAPEQIVTALEAKMKCGLGKCGRCNIGDQYVCTDGPVFRLDRIQRFLEAY